MPGYYHCAYKIQNMLLCRGRTILLIGSSLLAFSLKLAFSDDGAKIKVLQTFTDVFLGSQAGKPTFGLYKFLKLVRIKMIAIIYRFL